MMIRSEKIYDWLKWAGRYGLPAFQVFIFTLSEIFNFHPLAIASAVIAAVTVCLNTMLGQSNENYKLDVKNQAFDNFINEIETEIKNNKEVE